MMVHHRQRHSGVAHQEQHSYRLIGWTSRQLRPELESSQKGRLAYTARTGRTAANLPTIRLNEAEAAVCSGLLSETWYVHRR